MKKIITLAIAASVACSASALDRTDVLFPIGDATPWGWSLDDASALSETSTGVYTGTLWLEADKELKFLCQDDWGNMYGPAENGASPDADGKVTMAYYADGTPDNKMKVNESANYLITIDTKALTGTFVKSEYQAEHVNVCSLFMIGGATAGGWSVDQGTMMVQNADAPMTFTAKSVTLNAETFKITTAIKGGGSFDSKYYYFADPTDSAKMINNSATDDQWSIAEAGVYTVTADLATLTITIAKDLPTSASELSSASETIYYNLHGVRVANPSEGLYIRMADGKAEKILLRK